MAKAFRFNGRLIFFLFGLSMQSIDADALRPCGENRLVLYCKSLCFAISKQTYTAGCICFKQGRQPAIFFKPLFPQIKHGKEVRYRLPDFSISDHKKRRYDDFACKQPLFGSASYRRELPVRSAFVHLYGRQAQTLFSVEIV